MKRAAVVALVLLSCARPPGPVAVVTPAPTPAPVVGGRLLAETGTPLPLAHVAVLGADGKPGTPQEVSRAGAFRIPVASFTERLTRVRLTGAAHRQETLLVAREDGAVDVTVKLGVAAPHGEATPSVFLFAANDPTPKEKQMTKGPDGTFSAELEAPNGRYGYEIVGIANEALSGTPVDGWELMTSGEYRPQVVVESGKARIAFDTRSFHESAASFAFADETSASAGATKVALRVARREQKMAALLQELLHARGGPPGDTVERLESARRAETTALRLELATSARTAARPIVKQAAKVAYFTGPGIAAPSKDEEVLANEVLAEVAPEDPLWATFPAIQSVLRVAGATPKSRDYASAFIAKQPDSGAVSKLLIAQLVASKEISERRALVAELKKPRFAGSFEQHQANGYDPDRRLAPGKEVSFEVSALTGKSGAKLTPKDLVGKVFLVDVWGTWCAPCVAELPRLHELYSKYGGAPKAGRKKRFEIVSIALEQSAEPVVSFRADKAHPMPWLHGLADPDAFLESFGGEGLGVPLYVLVDEKGTILASAPELRPRDLPELLDRALR